MRLLRFLFFRRRRRAESAPIREEDAYAHSYGDRTGEVFGVSRKPEQSEVEPKPDRGPEAEARPEPAAEAKPDSGIEASPGPEPEPAPDPSGSRTGGLTGELLRRAFEAKLDARGRTTT